ncbi:MAG: glutamate synthase central domain-containing protein [Acidimicrobiales bacterium]
MQDHRRPPEHDACGIGFVADAHGRAQRHIIEAGLQGLAGVKHRGAVAADARTSDGCGLLTPLPHQLVPADTGVAQLFIRGARADTEVRRAVEAAAAAEGLALVDWREPPTDAGVLGELARRTVPTLRQAWFSIEALPDLPAAVVDRWGHDRAELAAYRLRRRIGSARPDTYVASCSFRTMVHKGLVPAEALADFWLDLHDERFAGAFAVFHQRFSTNTLPTWERAQPFRTLCHNGEINTLWGNENRLSARTELGTRAAGMGDEGLFRPVVDPETSDSGKLDEVVELLVRGGRHVVHAMAMVVPEAWEDARDLDPDVRGFYEFHSALMEPWDGPAGVVFTDGVGVGACLDRNGLRPLRYAVCEDGFVVCASEMGAVDVRGHGGVERGRLGPGHMLFVTPQHGVARNTALKAELGRVAPFARWAAEGFRPVAAGEPVDAAPDDLVERQVAHGFTKEEVAMILKPMATDGYEPTFSMGDDAPLAPLASRPRPVFHYLKQRFAQVTNPAIDPIRERRVMSLRTLLGPRAPLLEAAPDAARLLELPTFFLYPSGVASLTRADLCPFPITHLDATFSVSDGPDGLRSRVRALAEEAVAAVRAGDGIVLLDDGSIGPARAPVPSLLALGAVHHRLVDELLRSACSIVVVSDDARDTHAVACLLGYGADAVCPRLALQTVADEADRSDDDTVSPDAQDQLRTALEAGVLKILSKMGISTVDSYRGAQIFEVVGLGAEVVDECLRAHRRASAASAGPSSAPTCSPATRRPGRAATTAPPSTCPHPDGSGCARAASTTPTTRP